MKNVYHDSFDRTHMIDDVIKDFDCLMEDNEFVSIAGRLILRRKMGKMMFFNVMDETGNIQVFADIAGLGKEKFTSVANAMKIGDIVGLSGTLFRTRTEEQTISCRDLKVLTPTLRSLPEKFHGLSDIETRYRQRYLDLIANPETRDVFKKRSIIVKGIRSFLDSAEFVEVETPTFQRNPCGASANPFITHHDAKNVDLYLRISPETFLKQLIVGGMDKVYEIGKNFRNEGVDASHLQEFTMLEWYASYWNYTQNIEFSKKLIQSIVLKIFEGLEVPYQGMTLDFSKWQTVEYRDLVLADCGIDVLSFFNTDSLFLEIKNRGIDLGEISPEVSLGNLIDKLYKKVSRPKLIQPTILVHHPTVLIPLARPNDENPCIIDSFQILVNGWEIAKGYSELSDPKLQRQFLEEQSMSRKAGDSEAMFSDEDFLLALEYGMPPVSGVGIGIDRLTCILADQKNLTDVVLFPLMR